MQNLGRKVYYTHYVLGGGVGAARATGVNKRHATLTTKATDYHDQAS